MATLPPVVVLGVDCPTGLQAARIFAARGIGVFGLAADPSHPCARTRACTEVFAVGRTEDSVVERLVDISSDIGVGAVLVPCTDSAVLAAARGAASLTPLYRTSLPRAEVVERLLDKSRLPSVARWGGFSVPETRVLRSREDAEAAASTMIFPCVVKPSLKSETWLRNTSAKVFKVSSPSALLARYDQCRSWAHALVVQEWVHGLDRDHYTCNCYLSESGEELVSFTTRKLRQWPLDVGQASLSEECRNELVRAETVRLLRFAGHFGFGYLEMKHDARSGRHLILEANTGRPTGRLACAEAAGVEFHMTMYADVVGLPLPEQRVQRYRSVKWVHLRHDLQAAAALWSRGRLTLSELAHSWRGPRVHALLSWRDPVPFLADLLRSGSRLLRSKLGGGREPERAATRPLPTKSRVAGPRLREPVARHALRGPFTVVHFDLGGVVRVAALDPSPGDVERMAAVLGSPSEAPVEAIPHLVIRFVDEFPERDFRTVANGSTAYADDGLYILRSPTGRAVARLHPGDPGQPDVILCERGLEEVPLLEGMIDLVALERGWVPLHASAWSDDGVGMVAAGWGRSGKTGALLAFCESGARFVGDDRVFVSRDGAHMFGIDRPVRMRDWHIAQLPGLARLVGGGRRTLAHVGPWLGRIGERVLGPMGDRWPLVQRIARALLGRTRGRLAAHLHPERFPSTGPRELATPDVFIVMESHRDDGVVVQPLEPDTLAERLAAIVHAELLPVLSAQLSLRFAFPGSGWDRLERAPEAAARMIREATAGKPAYLVRHPYPCSLAELRSVLETLGRARPRLPDVRPRSAAVVRRSGWRAPARVKEPLS